MKTIMLSDKTGLKSKEHFQNKYQIKTLPKHNTLYMEGDQVFNVYYIIKGRLKIYNINELGKEYILHIFESGIFFGFDALLNSETHYASAVTMEECEIVIFPKVDFFDMISKDNKACFEIMQNLSSLLKYSENQLIKVAYNSSRKKIADAVLLIAKKYHTEMRENHSFRVSRSDLSALSGIAPESISRTLTNFKKEGLIEVENGQITILNIRQLEALKN